MSNNTPNDNANEPPDVEKRLVTGGAFAALETDLLDDSLIGNQYGEYRVTKRIAEGGMGVVCLGERQDGRYERVVAIKLLSSNVHARRQGLYFDREIRVLAELDHKNIARLYDAGTTHDGTAYLVMEYIDGQHFDEYHHNCATSLREKITHLRDLSLAVSNAHARLIVHRDIKPSNVLVDASSKPVLLDFGIAKVLHEEDDEATRTYALTPSFASPEQLLGQSLTVSSDVYQLGLLFLAAFKEGDTALTLDQAITQAANQQDRQISEEIKAHLPKEVIAIIEKCLSANLEERYQSATELADDLNRYLEGYPVHARAPSATRRFSKMLLRNKVASFAITAFAATLIAASIVTYLQREEALTAQAEAEEAALRAKQSTEFLTGLFNDNRPAEALGETLTARDILERGSERLQQLDDQPKLQAALLITIATVYRDLGDHQQGLDLANQALPLLQQHDAENIDARIDLNRLLSRANADLGNYDGALEHALQAVDLGETHLGTDNIKTIENMAALADAYQKLARLDEAEVTLRSALDHYTRVYGDDHAEVTTATSNLAVLLSIRGRFSQAAAMMEKVLEYNKTQLPEEHPWLAMDLFNYGSFLASMGQFERSKLELERALAMRIKLEGAIHPWTAIVHDRLAGVLFAQGEFSAAQAQYDQSLEVSAQTMKAPNQYLALNVAHYANFLRFTGNYQNALTWLAQAREQFDALFEPHHALVLTGNYYYALILKETGDTEQATALLTNIVSQADAPNARTQLVFAGTELARLLAKDARYAEAQSVAYDTEQRAANWFGEHSWHLAAAKLTNAMSLINMGCFQAASTSAQWSKTFFSESDPQQWRAWLAEATAVEASYHLGQISLERRTNLLTETIARLPELNAQRAVLTRWRDASHRRRTECRLAAPAGEPKE